MVILTENSMSANYLIIGLGNHGVQYQKHRHNIGYIVLDEICRNLIVNFDERKFSAIYGVKKIDNNKYFFIKPETYMNNSGISVQQFKNFYKIENKNIFVIHDELDLKSSQCKIKSNYADNGHNGLKSIDSLCGKEYFRLRIGVGRPKIKEMEISCHVLSDLDSVEIENAQKIAVVLAKNINSLFDEKKQSVVLNEIAKLKLHHES